MHVIKKKPAGDHRAKIKLATVAPNSLGVKQYLTVAEVAAMLQIKIGTIYQMVHQKRIPFREVGRHLRIEAAEIDTWTRTNSDNQ